MIYDNRDKLFEKRKEDWEEIENLVLTYQKQFNEESTAAEVAKSKQAADRLLDKFSPLFKKYVTLLKTGQIDWDDREMKNFICNFIDDKELLRALRRKQQAAKYRGEIYEKFNFIKETYGTLTEEEILIDLQSLLLVIARRYKQMGRNFCSYVYNAYRYEVGRHIKAYLINPLNIPYRNIRYEDYINGSDDKDFEQSYEDTYYEDLTGIPDTSWVLGNNCGPVFKNLSPLDRKILIKYYLEEWKDKQIADEFGMHINTVNQRRRSAAKKIADNIGIDPVSIKRTRRSGMKAVLSTH